ncbi:MAG: inositol monophosphatase [Chlorobi bacterium]|nr:inositol monophosphatase [Chlorobiota bacterium]
MSAVSSSLLDKIKEVGQFILSELNHLGGEDIDLKGKHDLVTRVDKESERRLIELLSDFSPSQDTGFLTEEFNPDADLSEHEWWWVVDPLDGTTNYVHRVPVFAISVALMHGSVKQGVVYDIYHDFMFYASEGKGAFLNGKRIYVSKESNVDNFLIATGFPFSDLSRAEEYLNMFKHLMREVQGLRRLGSAAIDLAYTAAGKFDGFFEYGLKPWDVAAGSLLVREAGGSVADFKGLDDYLFGREIIAGSPSGFEYLKKLCLQYF